MSEHDYSFFQMVGVFISDHLDQSIDDILSRYINEYEHQEYEGFFFNIKVNVLMLMAAKAKRAPSRSSKLIVNDFKKTILHLLGLLDEMMLAPDVNSAFYKSLLEVEKNISLINSVVTKKGIFYIDEYLKINESDLPEDWVESDVYSYISNIGELDKFYRIVTSKMHSKMADFREALYGFKRATENEYLSSIGGKGAKRDIAIDGFIYEVAKSLDLWFLGEYRITDSPNSTFFKLLDELLILAKIEYADRTLRERISNMIYETRADKWHET
ncbi:MAG: hypothetical protein KME65_03555 [Candidatus Thiodiazotropha sp. (ex Ctena orbiculata)]|uniref:Uncharacterized protein n=1 Tax=Candidatus Thiodiazotropha taylori TaxID=2792791 RepID=A0A944M6C9_9GAMM|nr:hypothetical protein [Candidatus Thiodiazotropha taylori]MBV2138793.1 hypothetical protein [Candidatus Thiodiazotropha taylori]